MKKNLMTIAFIYTEEKLWNLKKILVFRQKQGPKLLFSAYNYSRLDENEPREHWFTLFRPERFTDESHPSLSIWFQTHTFDGLIFFCIHWAYPVFLQAYFQGCKIKRKWKMYPITDCHDLVRKRCCCFLQMSEKYSETKFWEKKEDSR